MIAMLPTPSGRELAHVARRSCRATAFTYGQWLQMNMTTVPFLPRTESSEWRLPSVPGRSKDGAVVPGAAGRWRQAGHGILAWEGE